jgi:hypothetical protein
VAAFRRESSPGSPESWEEVGIQAAQAECEFEVVQQAALAAGEQPPGIARFAETANHDARQRRLST